MAKTPEGTVKASVKKLLDEMGIYHFSPFQAGMGRAGIPYIIACYNGLFLYGFPFDLTLEMAREEGLEVDEDGFRRLMNEQRDRAKADAKAKKSGHTDLSEYKKIADSKGASSFVGYTHNETESTINGILVDGMSVASAISGQDVEIVLEIGRAHV